MRKNYHEVSLPEVLDAREKRALRQRELLLQYQKPLLCFTMNIAGPVKNSLLIRQGFLYGLEDLALQLQRVKAEILYREIWDEATGNEAFLVIDASPVTIKRTACELEDADPLGRLYDMDLLMPAKDSASGFRKMEREELGFSGRQCLLCKRPAKECASRRIHPLSELVARTDEILKSAIRERTAIRIAELATRSLLYEVAITPKPGLVDRANNGSHRDMDFYSFLNSAAALWPYFKKCAAFGIQAAEKAEREEREDLPELFRSLRLPGKLAENQMLRATGGVNTHKGAIFSMGILCAAVASLPADRWDESETILSICARMTKGIVAEDYKNLTVDTAKTEGQKLYLEYGITGVRGQMEEGLPAVSAYGLPLLEKLLAEGRSTDEAGAAVLLAILSHTTDTNLIARSDLPTQREASRRARELLEHSPCPPREKIETLEQEFIRKNLSPGGSADLLALCWMLHFLKTDRSP